MSKDLRVLIKIKNNLIFKKAEELWGKEITQAEIARRSDMRDTAVGALVNFKLCPIKKRKNGEMEWNFLAIKIATALQTTPEDLFPEHLQEIRKNSYKLELEAAEILVLMDSEQKSPEMKLIEEETEEAAKYAIKKALRTLSSRERLIIRKRFGFDDEEIFDPCKEGATLEEIAEDMDLSRERIRQLEQRALRKLRYPTQSRELKEFY